MQIDTNPYAHSKDMRYITEVKVRVPCIDGIGDKNYSAVSVISHPDTTDIRD